MYKFITILSATLLIAIHIPLAAQDWEDVEIQTKPLTEHVHMLVGQGGNIGVLVTDDFLVMVDDQFEPLFDKISASLAELSKQPVRYVINTHWHGDHTGGNTAFSNAGATLVAHQKVQARMESGSKIEFFGREVPPAANTAVPELTFRDDVVLTFGSEEIHLIHAPNAHTDGDALVFFKTSNVIHMGDLYFAGMFPFIDLSSGGSIEGVIAGCERALTLADENTQIIPGHGPLSDKASLNRYKDMLADMADRVGDMKGDGKDLKDVIEAQNGITGPYQDDFGGGFISAKDLLTFIYNSL